MNILIATNSKYIPFTKIMLTSLFRQHPLDEIDVYLTYEDLDENEVLTLSTFINQFTNKKLIPIRVGSYLKTNVETYNGISIDTYYRILAIDLLPQTVNKILYLDVDMVIKKPIDELYNVDITDKPFAVCEDILGILNDFHEANKIRMNIPPEYTYFNAGVMLMNIDYLRKTNACKMIMDSVFSNYHRYEYNDQDVLNELYFDNLILIPWQKFNCPPALYISPKSSHMDIFLSYAQFRDVSKDSIQYINNYANVTREVGENACIIHYMGNTKPWSDTRQDSDVYKIFDTYFYEAKVDLKEILSQYISKYYSYEYMSLMIDAAQLESTDTIIMGSSYGLHALDIRQFKTETNISATSQDLEHDYLLLNHILNTKTDGKIKNLILILGKYALFDKMNKSEMGRNIIKTVYAPILFNDDIWSEFEKISDSQKNTIRMTSRNIILKGQNYFNDSYTREDNCEEQYKGYHWNSISEEDRVRLSSLRTSQHNRLIKSNDSYDIKLENISYLNKILELANSNNIKTTVIIPPFTKYYNQSLDESFMSELMSALNESPYELSLFDFNEYVLDEKIDSINNNNICFDNGNFFDMDHLNSSGAQKFTNILLNYIL